TLYFQNIKLPGAKWTFFKIYISHLHNHLRRMGRFYPLDKNSATSLSHCSRVDPAARPQAIFRSTYLRSPEYTAAPSFRCSAATALSPTAHVPAEHAGR